jgi:hypothetical protein
VNVYYFLEKGRGVARAGGAKIEWEPAGQRVPSERADPSVPPPHRPAPPRGMESLNGPSLRDGWLASMLRNSTDLTGGPLCPPNRPVPPWGMASLNGPFPREGVTPLQQHSGLASLYFNILVFCECLLFSGEGKEAHVYTAGERHRREARKSSGNPLDRGFHPNGRTLASPNQPAPPRGMESLNGPSPRDGVTPLQQRSGLASVLRNSVGWMGGP